MATIDTPSSDKASAETLELEMDLEIPVLGIAEHKNNELESLRSAYEAATAIRDELQEKLKIAIEYSNEQAKVIKELM